MIRAVVFDLDGTLLNTIDDISGSANYALAKLGYPTYDVERYKHFVGNGVDVLIGRILPEDARQLEKFQELKTIYMERYTSHSTDRTRPYAGICETLDKIKAMGTALCVVSNKPDDQVKLTVGRFFVEDLFSVSAGGGGGFPLKPDPSLTLHILDSIGVPPSAALFVGDTGVDMMTAKNAGCTAIGVTWGFRCRDELERNGADRIIDDPSELLPLVG